MAVTAPYPNGGELWRRAEASRGDDRPSGFTGRGLREPGWYFFALPGSFDCRPAIGTDRTRQCGELRLLLAVLKDALEAVTTRPSYRPDVPVERAAAEARAWIFSNDRSSPFTFVVACELLGIDPGYVRARVVARRARRTATPVGCA